VGSSVRYLGCAVGFGFGVMWMTAGFGAAILSLLCAALGFGLAFAVEHERAGLGRLRPTNQNSPDEDEPLLRDEFELDDYGPNAELPEDDRVPIAVEVGYGWPVPKNG
jgi:hypothetical protein